MAAVAHRWGSSSPAHFSRTFRDVYGMSPTERQRLRPLIHSNGHRGSHFPLCTPLICGFASIAGSWGLLRPGVKRMTGFAADHVARPSEHGDIPTSFLITHKERRGMPSLKRFGPAVASAAVLTSLFIAVAPAATAATTPQTSDPVPVVQESKTVASTVQTCAALSAQLATQLQAAQTALAATPPDLVAAQAAVTAAQATVVQLQAQLCLPTVPTTSPICVALALQLKQEVQALAVALATFPPNQLQISMALNAVLTTSAALQANSCVNAA